MEQPNEKPYLKPSSIEESKENDLPLPPPRPQSQQDEPASDEIDPLESILCFLCQEPIAYCIEAICGHAFCQHCLSEYLLVAKDCPICGQKIREKKWACNKRLDEFIEQFCNYAGQEDAKKLRQRKQMRRMLKQQRIATNLNAGAEVDVRDEDYIWQKGRIIRTFNRLSGENARVKFLVVQYLESERKEQFSSNSIRIAKPGFYSNRDDIPHYNSNKPSIEEMQQKPIRNYRLAKRPTNENKNKNQSKNKNKNKNKTKKEHSHENAADEENPQQQKSSIKNQAEQNQNSEQQEQNKNKANRSTNMKKKANRKAAAIPNTEAIPNTNTEVNKREGKRNEDKNVKRRQ